VTYYLDVERKVITLTTFRKQRDNERRERLQHPITDQDAYRRAYAEADLASRLSEIVYRRHGPLTGSARSAWCCAATSYPWWTAPAAPSPASPATPSPKAPACCLP